MTLKTFNTASIDVGCQLTPKAIKPTLKAKFILELAELIYYVFNIFSTYPNTYMVI